MATLEQELQSKFKDEQHKVMLNIVFTGNWLMHRHAVFLKPHDLSPQQYNILRILRGSGVQMTMNDIRSRMLDRNPNVTRMSDRLIEKGLVERIRCEEDRRVVYLKISEHGNHLLGKLDLEWEATDLPERKLSDEQAKMLNQLLDYLRTI